METQKREELITAYKDVFSSENGKKVLEDLDRQCMYHRNAFNPNSDRITSYNLGCQWVVQYIHTRLDKNLMEEQKNEVINDGVDL